VTARHFDFLSQHQSHAMFTSPSFARALREAAPGLSRRYFSCPCRPIRAQRIHTEASAAFKRAGTTSHPWSRSVVLAPARSFQRNGLRSTRFFSSTRWARAAETAPAEGHTLKKSPWPESSSNIVAYWLLGSAASVFGIVIFGGLTRLTESGYAYLTQARRC
jgi:heme a synthase